MTLDASADARDRSTDDHGDDFDAWLAAVLREEADRACAPWAADTVEAAVARALGPDHSE